MPQIENTFDKQIITDIHLNYLLYLPEDYDKSPDFNWPLVLFLHGAGESGDDVQIVARNGIPKLASKGSNFPFIAVSPQCPSHTWENHFDALDLLLEEICSIYRVDLSKIYVTGLSMGGYGTWDLAMVFPDRFAAIAPVCGGSVYPESIGIIKELPIWAFHGAKDDIVPIEESQTLVEALKEMGSSIRFTVYPEAGHDSWTETYNNPELYTWLLQQMLKS